MAETEKHSHTLIYEARPKTPLTRPDGKSLLRTANFLKPLAKHGSEEADGIPNTPLLSELFPQNLQQWPSKVVFKGWRHPQKKWSQWVDRLAPKYGSIWRRTGIHDAIMSSVKEIRCNPELVLGLSEFWCPETNTFVFPWGEATITLEDVMVLGGFPVMGKVVASPVTEKSIKIEDELNRKRKEICRSKAKKAGHCHWLKQFMEEDTQYEHVGFLSLWLSRFVFPSLADETLGNHVFPIAINISLGKQMAIAPAVLASLYRDLSSLHVRSIASEEIIAVSAPFQILQLWAFEHFPLLANSPNSLNLGEPRAARWHKLNAKINLPLVRSTLKVAENFQWRPYAAYVGNWRYPSYYRKFPQWLSNSSNLDPGLQVFFKFLQGLELVGVDCKEKYSPHRVAMQFGLDQDIPAKHSKFKFNGKNVGFFIPEMAFVPGVSRRYAKWWKDMMLDRSFVVKDLLLQGRYAATVKFENDAKKVSPTRCYLSSDSSDAESDDDDMVLTSRLRVLGHTNVKKVEHAFRDATENTVHCDVAEIVMKKPSGKPDQNGIDLTSEVTTRVSSRDSNDDVDHMPLSKRSRLAQPYTESSGSSRLDLSCNRSGNEEASNGTSRKKKIEAGGFSNDVEKKISRGFISSLKAFTRDVEAKPEGVDEPSMEGQAMEAGKFPRNFVHLGDYIYTDAIKLQKMGGAIELDWRIKRLEKLVGLVPAEVSVSHVGQLSV